MQQSKFYENARVDIARGIFETKRVKEHNGSLNKHSGYWSIGLRHKGEKGHATIYVHRAIFQEAVGFILPAGFVVHHRDGNPDHNWIDNLCLCTQRFNVLEAMKTRDNKKIYESRKKNGWKQKIKACCAGEEQEFASQRQCSKVLGINQSRISAILTNTVPWHTAYSKKLDKKFTFVRVN